MFNRYRFQSRSGRGRNSIRMIAGLSIAVGVSMFTASAQEDTVQHGKLKDVYIQYTPPTVRTSANITTISLPQIKKLQGNGSVNNLLEWMPSMVTTSDAGTGIGYTYMRIRGIDQTRINVTLNGVTVNDAESQGSWLVNLPDLGSYVEDVQVQSGANTSPGSISYGARIDFRTRDIPERAFAEAGVSYGSFNTLHTNINAGTGLIGKRFSAMASFSDIRSDGFIDRASARLNATFATAQYRLLDFKRHRDYGTLKFNILHGTEHTGLAWNAVPADSLATNRTYNSCGEYYTADGERRYYADEKDNYRQTHYQLNYVKNWDEPNRTVHHSLNVAAHLTRGIGYYQQYKDDKKPSKYGLQALFPDSLKTCDFITQKYLDNYYYGIHADYAGNVRFKTEKFSELFWQAGADVDNYQGKHYGNVIWSEPGYVCDFPYDYQWYNGTGDKFQTKIFGSVQYLYDGFSVRAELQYRNMDYKIAGTDDNMLDVAQQYRWNFLNPKIALHYYLDKGKSLKHSFDLSFSTANREPTRSDIIEGPSDKKPVPETLYDLEFSYMMHHSKFYLNATIYGMYYHNQLVLTGELNDVGASIMQNVDKSYRAGIELAVAYKPVRFFQWRINGNFSRNRIIDFVTYVDNYDGDAQIEEQSGNTPISFSPDIVLANEFTFTPLPKFDITFSTKFVGKQYMDNSGNDTYCLKPYTYSNLRLEYRLDLKRVLESINFFVQVNNVFNTKYESNGYVYSYYSNYERHSDAGYYPQAGINFLGGIRVRF